MRGNVYCDNQAVMLASNNRQCSWVSNKTAIVNTIFEFVMKDNIDLRLHGVPSAENLADAESR